MRSTGSMTVVAKDVFVPDYRALCMYTARGGNGFPGAATNPSPAFQVALPAFAGHGIAAVGVGNAQAALELTIEMVKERSTSYTSAKMRDIQAVQIRVGAAASRIDAAYQLLRKECLELQDYANRGEVPAVETKLRCKRNCAYAVSLCTEAVDILHAMAGANGIYETYPIETIFRDAHALAGHFSFGSDVQFSTWGFVALGGEFVNPLL
jgi:3-hydroxy-9,10-secoandrosta-1,3,5(10)-triene-9,17-dione monooxygenase